MSAELTSDVGTEGGFVCLVDGDGEYNLSEEKMTNLIKHVDPEGTQDYSIVGIMGCQSTGKSTLLNRLFKTQFQMMNASSGRSQTTKGIWLDAARNTHNLVIMDLEGTDSGERGEDRTTFERQTILYALALCEILIVNMWETDIGRYTASNYGIMKTVFEVNMQLFQSKGKTQLLFIIRDYNQNGTPFHTLRERLLREIQLIWDELNKPELFKDSKMTDFFDFRFSYLPHFVYCRDRFEDLALDLQKRFTQSDHPDSFLATEYHGSKSVPAESFAIYAQNIWNTIKNNQDLNLPSQREMLATYRCDELVSSLTASYTEDLRQVSLQASNEFNPCMGRDINEYVSKYLQQYDTSCEKYLQDVVRHKRRELLHRLLSPIQEMIASSIKGFLYSNYVKEFESKINSFITVPGDIVYGVMEKSTKLKLEYCTTFKQKSLALIDGLPEEYCEELRSLIEQFQNDFDEKLQQILNTLRKEQLQALETTFVTQFVNNTNTRLTQLLTAVPKDMWEQIGKLFSQNFKLSLNDLSQELKSLSENDDTTILSIEERLLKECELFIFEQVFAVIPLIGAKMRDRFEELFLYDHGSLRQWKASDNPQQLFDTARSAAINILQTFTTFRLRKHWAPKYHTIVSSSSSASPQNAASTTTKKTNSSVVNTEITADDDDDDDEQDDIIVSTPSTLGILITKEETFELEKELDRKIQSYLTTSIADVERAKSQTGLPPWVVALLLVLGYDEFIYLLTNPFILFFIIMIGTGIFVLYKLNMLDPAITISKAVGQRLLFELTNVIAPPVSTTSATGNNSQQQAIQQQRRTSVLTTGNNTPATNTTSLQAPGFASNSTHTKQLPPRDDDTTSVKSRISSSDLTKPLTLDVVDNDNTATTATATKFMSQTPSTTKDKKHFPSIKSTAAMSTSSNIDCTTASSPINTTIDNKSSSVQSSSVSPPQRVIPKVDIAHLPSSTSNSMISPRNTTVGLNTVSLRRPAYASMTLGRKAFEQAMQAGQQQQPQ